MAWKSGNRDVWADDGSRVAEIVCNDWKQVSALIAAAPDLCRALQEMIQAFETARDNTVSARLLNERRLANARRTLEKARPKE